MTNTISTYFNVWLMMAKNAFLTWFSRRNLLLIFLAGKIIRYTFYFGFLFFLVSKTGGLLGYTGNQVLFFTSTYILIDTLAQFFFRNVYTFRSLVVTGDFDLILLKPINSLFRILLGGPDPIDLITIPPLIFITWKIGVLLNPSPINTFLYLLLFINGLMIAMAFHIAVLALGILTMEMDHTIMVYRDLGSMGRLPIDIYKEPLKSFLTFVVPVGIMVTLPAKALMGMVSYNGIFISVLVGISALLASLRFWNFALKKYTSASS